MGWRAAPRRNAARQRLGDDGTGAVAHSRTAAITSGEEETMTEPNETAEPSGASGGSMANEPVAWAVVDDRGLQLALHPTPDHAASMARNFGKGVTEVVPLYRHRWIPIDDQWPDHLSDVLVAYKCGDYIRLGVGEFDGTIEKDGLVVPYFKGIGGFEVTHWMRLPAPPTYAK